MRHLPLATLCLAASFHLGGCNQSVDLDINDNLDEDEFLAKFGLPQISDQKEKERRSEALKRHEEIVKRENVKYEKGKETWVARINDFSDLPEDERVKLKTGKNNELSNGGGFIPHGPEMRDERSEQYFDKFRYSRAFVPSSYSSVDRGDVSEVKNQGQCASCCAFATMAVIETCFKRLTGVFGDYSEQELLDCSQGYSNGCRGGWLYSYPRMIVDRQRRLASERTYPYKGYTSFNCPREKPYNQGAKVSDYYWTDLGDEEVMKKLVYEHGAVMTTIIGDNNFMLYGEGILDGCSHNGYPNPDYTNHAVAVVGYGTEGGIDFWLIKNSYGPYWGDKGFIKVKRGSSRCGVGKFISTVSCASQY